MLLQRTDKIGRILLCAPSNSAADLLVDQLTGDEHMPHVYRLHAPTRRTYDTPSAAVRRHSGRVTKAMTFALPDMLHILRHSVIITTCSMAASMVTMGLQPVDFTHIMIDEAAYADEPQSLIPVTAFVRPDGSTSVVLCGDHRQLGAVVKSTVAQGQGLNVSWMERIMLDADTNLASPYHATISAQSNKYMTMLKHNYRSHASILHVPNQLYYGSQLQASAPVSVTSSLLLATVFPNKAHPIVFDHLDGCEQRAATGSIYNMQEVWHVLKRVQELTSQSMLGVRLNEIAIVTPYRAQVRKLQQAVKQKGWSDSGLLIGTVESLQGQERRCIIISTVRSKRTMTGEVAASIAALGFLRSGKRLNVALTRAQAGLIIIGNAEMLRIDPDWNTLIGHCQQLNAYRVIDLGGGHGEPTFEKVMN